MLHGARKLFCADLALFQTGDFSSLVQALAAKHSAGPARAECYPGVGNSCPCRGECVCEVPPKVRGSELDFSRTVLATAAVVSVTCARANCHPSVGDRWARHGTFRRNRPTPFSLDLCGQPARDCGCGHFIGGLALRPASYDGYVFVA